jgi:hypothetical protein
MMGGRWAYESLNFGGYWAWDPVENASMVPWLTLIGGIHTLLIYKHTGHSLRATHFLFLITFNLVLYSTFLTRSGVLGDTSVHAFTDLGMNFQLLAFLFVFLIPSFVFYAIRYKSIPHIVKEEQTSSREFWMFIGSLIFFLTALFITIATSLPVINKIFGSNFTMGDDAVFTGDLIFIRSVGRPDLGGKLDEWTPILWKSVSRSLAAWAPSIRVMPAHYASDAERESDRSVARPLARVPRPAERAGGSRGTAQHQPPGRKPSNS